jgi:hypothetical protein
MRIIQCDACGESFGRDDDLIEMIIPASFLEEEGPGISIDICGWPCVSRVVDSALNKVDEADQEDSQPEQQEGERFIAVPKIPSIDVDMDAQTLAKFTEQVTGVKRR